MNARASLASSFACLLAAACATPAPEPLPPNTPPTGEIAFARGGAVVLLDVATNAERVLVADNDYDRPLVWLPDGERLVYWNHAGGAWDLWAVAPATGAKQNLTRSASDARSAAGSPDGLGIAFQRGGQGVWWMDANGGNQRVLDARGHRDAAPVWSPSGRRLAFTDLASSGDGVAMTAHVLELVGGAAVRSTALGNGEVQFFRDDDHLVLAAGHDGRSELVVVDLTTNERTALTRSPARDGHAVLAPDRASIVWIEWHEGATRLMRMPAAGGDAQELAAVGSPGVLESPSFAPDGRHVAFASGPDRKSMRVQIVPVAGGAPRAVSEPGASFPVWRPAARAQ
jgi:TolB protein